LAVLCVLTIGSSGLGAVSAAPNAPQYVPDQVGRWGEAEKICADVKDIPMPNYFADVAKYFQVKNCEDGLARVKSAFQEAYRQAEAEGLAPGYPTNDIHPWIEEMLLQDFSGSPRGDGWGALIANYSEGGPKGVFYVGGPTWRAYERAVNTPSVLGDGIFPGYPTGLEHKWNRVTIQDFSGGSWGITAIIGGDQSTAWVVAGNHLQAYIDYDGSNTLGNPLGPVEYVNGWYVQNFEDGKILELDGQIDVQYHGGEAPDEFPPVGREEPTSPPIQQIEPDNTQDEPEVAEPEAPQEDAPIVEPTSPPVDNSEQPPADEGEPVVPAEPDSDSCVEGAEPVVTKFDVPDDVVAYNVNTAPVYYDIEIENRGCEAWDPGYIQVIDENNGHGLYSGDQEIVEPGEVLEIENFNYFDSVGTHTLYITADNGGVLSDETGSRATLEIVVEDLGYDGENSDDLSSTDLAQFTAMCHYY
jgi:hypothetical protein